MNPTAEGTPTPWPGSPPGSRPARVRAPGLAVAGARVRCAARQPVRLCSSLSSVRCWRWPGSWSPADRPPPTDRVPERRLPGAAAGAQPAADPPPDNLRARPRTGWSTTRSTRRPRPIPVRCDSQPINVATADDAQLERTSTAGRVHDAGLAAAGDGGRVRDLPARRSPSTAGDHHQVRRGRLNAFYCSADQQIYFSNQLPAAVPIVQENKWAADVVMAHEFGHAIQGRTGSDSSAHMRWRRTATTSRSRTSSSDGWRPRPTACPACSCGPSRARSASSRPMSRGIQATYVAVGDDTLTGDPNVEGNHGLARSREYWGTTGPRYQRGRRLQHVRAPQRPGAIGMRCVGMLSRGRSVSRAVAIAAMPSPRPVSPSPSVVVAETMTGAPTASASTPPPRPDARRTAVGCRSAGRRR